MAEPIIEFKTQAELESCLAEWQERLFLHDLIIKCELCDISKDDNWGETIGNYISMKATIKLYQCMSDNIEIKKCMEKTLVHELLHLSMHVIEYDDDASVEECFFDSEMHRRIEQMARALISAKYNIPLSWFKNI